MNVIDEAIKCQARVVHINTSAKGIAVLGKALISYQQRVGRTGRTDGNSFVVAIANGRPHDLFFWADPLTMISGGVETPGFYLDASAILQRQLTAYCLDRWISRASYNLVGRVL